MADYSPPKWTVTVNGVDGKTVHTFDTKLEAQRFADRAHDMLLARPEDKRN